MTQPDTEYVDWLVEQSMLHNAKKLATRYAGQARLWQQPYAETRPRAASALASVWFTAYPARLLPGMASRFCKPSATSFVGGLICHWHPGCAYRADEAGGRYSWPRVDADDRRQL